MRVQKCQSIAKKNIPTELFAFPVFHIVGKNGLADPKSDLLFNFLTFSIGSQKGFCSRSSRVSSIEKGVTRSEHFLEDSPDLGRPLFYDRRNETNFKRAWPSHL